MLWLGRANHEPLDEVALSGALSEKSEVIFAYLFGSQARSSPHALSDVDLAIYLDTDRPDESNALLKVWSHLEMRTGRGDFDLVALNSATPLLAHRAVVRGRLIFSRDEGRRRRFVEEVVRRYLDAKPLYRLQRHYLIERIRRGRFGHIDLHEVP